MLFPFMPNRVERITAMRQLSREPPDLYVHRWGQYKSDVPSLDPEELKKIDATADAIVMSFDSPLPVRAILLQGHADYDHLKSGKAREDFEMRISKARAHEVRKELQARISSRAFDPQRSTLAALLFWEEEGFGSHRRVYTSPQNEQQRSMNRRVEGFFARGVRPRQSGLPLMACPHGGRVTRGPFASGHPSAADGWIVVGCKHEIGPYRSPSPCLYVTWTTTDFSPVIDRDSIGICRNIRGVSQGHVVMLP
jgi:hypothetical protein